MKEDNQAVIKALNMYGRVPEMWELLEEIERLQKVVNDLSVSNDAYLFTGKDIDVRDKEIERLNNIINELEHHLYQEWLEWKDSDCESIYSRAGEDKAIYDYIQELKGSDKE